MTEDKYCYNRFGSKAVRVGQAVLDITSKDNLEQYTAEDIFEGCKQEFVDELAKTIENSKGKFTDPYYILVFTKKEPWAVNVVRNWFVARQTKPMALDMHSQYPNHLKTLYKVWQVQGDVDIEWSIPAFEECKSVLHHPQSFDPKLVDWIVRSFSGTLDGRDAIRP
jgi:hypothetical protein